MPDISVAYKIRCRYWKMGFTVSDGSENRESRIENRECFINFKLVDFSLFWHFRNANCCYSSADICTNTSADISQYICRPIYQSSSNTNGIYDDKWQWQPSNPLNTSVLESWSTGTIAYQIYQKVYNKYLNYTKISQIVLRYIKGKFV